MRNVLATSWKKFICKNVLDKMIFMVLVLVIYNNPDMKYIKISHEP